ncbi:MAG: VOC family protein [Chloroflexaceae bacterium]|jgi:predicted enzyme related to lactoylglutathione lyase|nr:VOC family protein [Chloroflexaceae bacterium]
MPSLNTIDLVVRDVPAAAAFFRDVVGLTLRFAEERFAELDGGGVTIMLTPDALVPTRPAAGIILHFQVDDVAAALEQARSQGAQVLRDPFTTDWGWESALIAGPEEVVVDLYRPVGTEVED